MKKPRISNVGYVGSNLLSGGRSGDNPRMKKPQYSLSLLLPGVVLVAFLVSFFPESIAIVTIGVGGSLFTVGAIKRNHYAAIIGLIIFLAGLAAGFGFPAMGRIR